ncbi:MAG TPA: DNA-3-methyladenine glycosylase I [Candidatus Nanoarchaeia archaeon]|nr:DNA-3-methyladenine glycosylase I [Candidatus Nanoarchaeia archaeon]
MAENNLKRCDWCLGSVLMKEYHDSEWGFPNHDDVKHFEFLVLEAAQAGLSWATVLKKREGYRKAFHNYDFKKMLKMTEKDVENLMNNPGIIRNRLKITSALSNVKPFMAIQKEYGSFDKYLWNFVNGKAIQNSFKSMSELPSKTSLSDAISKDLKARGFRFVGSTVIYSHLQAVGITNDHLISCFRHKICAKN